MEAGGKLKFAAESILSFMFLKCVRKRTALLGALALFMACLSGRSDAQSIDLKYVEFVTNRLVVHYDLSDTTAGRSYSVRLYSSLDGYLNSLEKVSGDVGLEIKPGKNKTIVWEFRQEPGITTKGRVAVELKAQLFIPFINTDNINGYKIFKRGRSYNLTWSGGSAQNILNFDLMKGDRKITTFPNLANVGHHSFDIPSYVKPGKNYRFRISDSKNKEDMVYTSLFRVKRKTPLFIKTLSLAGLAAGVYVLVSGSSSGPQDIPAFPQDKLPK